MQEQAGPLESLSDVEPNAGGGDPGGTGHHRPGDFTLAAPGFPMYNLLRLQVLSGQEEKARPLHDLKVSTSVHVPRTSGVIMRNTEIKPHLVNLPPPCQTLEVPLCPDFELGLPVFGIRKGIRKACLKRRTWVLQSQPASLEHVGKLWGC